MPMSCNVEVGNHFPYTVDVQFPVTSPYSPNKMMFHKNHLLDIWHPEFARSHDCSMVKELQIDLT